MAAGWNRVTDAQAHFMSKVRYTAYGCWEWTLSLDPDGYGRFRCHGHAHGTAQSWSYRLFRGPIDSGLETHHLCNNPSCLTIPPVNGVGFQSRVRWASMYWRMVSLAT